MTRTSNSHFHGAMKPSLKSHKDTLPGLVVHGATDMPPARGIFRQEHITGTKSAPGTISDFYLNLTFEPDDILPPWSIMPVNEVIATGFPENDARSSLKV